MFEIINKNKRQSNLVTGSNNQLIPPVVTAQLGNSIGKFDDILDDTVSKFNDAKWCVGQMLESRQKQAEMKLKEEERKKEEEEWRKLEEKKLQEAEEERKRVEEDKKREQAKKKEDEEKRKQEEERRKEEEKQRQEREKSNDNNQDLFNDFISPGFDFNINEVMDKTVANNNNNNNNGDSNNNGNDIPNPADILSSIDYPDLNFGPIDGNNNDNNDNGTNTNNNGDQMNDGGDSKNSNDLDLDINNVLGNNDLILDGLNMSLLDQEDELNNQTNNNDDFDVDNFLNQFAGND